MTRGKYASSAEKTRHLNTAVSELEAGRNAIARLTAENKKLRAELESERQLHRERVRVLDAQLREGVSSELLAARLEIQAARDDAATARTEARVLLKKYKTQVNFFYNLMRNVGLTHIETLELLSTATDDLGEGFFVVEDDIQKKLPQRAVLAIARARGLRR